MNSALYSGRVWHRRNRSVEHAFSYAYTFLALDFSEQDSWRALRPMLGIDRFGLYQIRSRNYLATGDESLTRKLEQALQAAGTAVAPGRILLLTTPTLLGYGFTPVSFYFLYDADDHPLAFVPEVHNTFADVHVYPQPIPAGADNADAAPDDDPLPEFVFDKRFYVSPFLAVAGRYRIRAALDRDRFRITIDLVQDDHGPVFSAGFQGEGRPLTRRALGAALLRRPLTPWLTMARIHHQALRLRPRPGIGVFPRPPATDPATVRHHHEGPVERLRLRLLHRWFRPADTDS